MFVSSLTKKTEGEGEGEEEEEDKSIKDVECNVSAWRRLCV